MKKKIIAITLCVAMLAIAIVGGTLAYFTDTQTQTNTFVSGKVDISMNEAVVELNDNGDYVAVADGSRTEANQEYRLYPAQSIVKDPTITVAADSEDAYVAAIISVTGDIHSLIGVEGYDNIDIMAIADGGLLAQAASQVNGWNGLGMVYETSECVVYQQASKASNTWNLFVFMTEAQAANDQIVLFNTLNIPAEWDNEEMALINGMQISVNAFAVQTNSFDSCYEAMTTAFPTEFAAVK